MDEKALTRRRFLELLGISSGAAFAGLHGVALAEEGGHQEQGEPKLHDADPLAKHQWVVVVDLRRCEGCGLCTKACQEAHYLPEEQTWLRVYEMTGSDGKRFYMPRLCMHCEVAPCVKVCPVKASFKSPDGLTLVDQNVCIGCRMCMAACPYEARYFNWSDPPEVPANTPPPRPELPIPQQRGTVGKCVLCVHLLREGKLPMCLEACAMEAIYVGDLNSDLATNGREVIKLSEYLKANDVIRYKEELNTRPRLYYVVGHGQQIKF